LNRELTDGLLDNHEDHVMGEAVEVDNRVEPISDSGENIRSTAVNTASRFVAVASNPIVCLPIPRARIRCHEDHDIAEIRLSAVVVRQCRVIHYLEKGVEDIRMGLFNFIEQQHGMRILSDSLGEEPPSS